MLKKEETILKEILWGERPIHHLQFVKIVFHRDNSGYRFDNPRGFSVTAGPQDIARGLLRYRQEGAKLTEWAGFILSASDLFPLQLHQSEQGKRIHAELESLSGGGEFSLEGQELARELVPEFPKKRPLGEPDPPGTPT